MRGANLSRKIVQISQALHERGWVANHDGNVSTKVSSERFLVTPTATSKADVSERSLVQVNALGERVAGTARAFGELPLHLALYQTRGDIGAVVHAHPVHASAIACSGQNLIEVPFISEAVVSLGAWIPLLKDSDPKTLAKASSDVDAVLMLNHGVVAWGANLEQAFLRMELVEHLAKIALAAIPLGGVQPLTEAQIHACLEKRSRAGLGSAADKALASRRPQQAKLRAPQTRVSGRESVPALRPRRAAEEQTLERLVREEIVQALKPKRR